MYKQTFCVPCAFRGPIDVYLIKSGSRLFIQQVNSQDARLDKLDDSAELAALPDYTRLAAKHSFEDVITVDCQTDLVLVDSDICSICELPEFLRELENNFENHLDSCYNEL